MLVSAAVLRPTGVQKTLGLTVSVEVTGSAAATESAAEIEPTVLTELAIATESTALIESNAVSEPTAAPGQILLTRTAAALEFYGSVPSDVSEPSASASSGPAGPLQFYASAGSA